MSGLPPAVAALHAEWEREGRSGEVTLRYLNGRIVELETRSKVTQAVKAEPWPRLIG